MMMRIAPSQSRWISYRRVSCSHKPSNLCPGSKTRLHLTHILPLGTPRTNRSSSGGMMLIRRDGSHPQAFNLAHQTMKYSRVRFRKDPDGNVIAFEKCGCEAGANTFRPCREHQGDQQQEA